LRHTLYDTRLYAVQLYMLASTRIVSDPHRVSPVNIVTWSMPCSLLRVDLPMSLSTCAIALYDARYKVGLAIYDMKSMGGTY
jgi:hypothetical protein